MLAKSLHPAARVHDGGVDPVVEQADDGVEARDLAEEIGGGQGFVDRVGDDFVGDSADQLGTRGGDRSGDQDSARHVLALFGLGPFGHSWNLKTSIAAPENRCQR